MSASMSRPQPLANRNDGRPRAAFQFIAATFYYFLVRILSRHAAQEISSPIWQPLAEQALLVFLLLLGYAGLGFSLNSQSRPLSTQGFPLRRGWFRESLLGLATGWSAAVLCVAVLAVFGGIAVHFNAGIAPWGWLLADAAFFLLLTLSEELVFRGYPYQRLSRAIGPSLATLAFSLLFALLFSAQPGSTHATAFVGFVFSFLLYTAYLRTRALWMSWGLNFGWKASRALLFGLAVSGNTAHSPVVEGNPMGHFWLTGGGFGLDGSWFAFLVLLAFVVVVYRLTRELDYQHNTPELIPGGIPVDIDAAARRQHDAAMGQQQPAAPSLVQILPMAAPPPIPNDKPASGVK